MIVRRKVTMSVMVPCSVTMVVQKDTDLVESEWAVFKTLSINPRMSISPRDLMESIDDANEFSVLDAVANAAEDLR